MITKYNLKLIGKIKILSGAILIMIIFFPIYNAITGKKIEAMNVDNRKIETLKSSLNIKINKIENIRKVIQEKSSFWDSLPQEKRLIDVSSVGHIKKRLQYIKSNNDLISLTVTSFLPLKNAIDTTKYSMLNLDPRIVKITFEAYSDYHVFRMLEELTRSVGVVFIDFFNMKKINQISNKKIYNISEGKKVTFVQGEVILHWYVIQN